MNPQYTAHLDLVVPDLAASCGSEKKVPCSLQVVPHSWHIINDQDAVAKAPKFLVLYKRAGQRVVINANSDMLVRPSFIENSLNSLLSWHGSKSCSLT